MRHTDEGDVIKLSVTADVGADIRVTVADGGYGIPAGQLPHVFDRFRIGDGRHPHGTGLGLALVRAVARAHGGEVMVRSGPGRGSDFELLLPWPARAPEPEAELAGLEVAGEHARANLEGSLRRGKPGSG